MRLIFLCFLVTKGHYYLVTLSKVFCMVHFVVLMHFSSLHCHVTFYVLNILLWRVWMPCVVCFVSDVHRALLFVVLATSLFWCCPFYFGGGYFSFHWFTHSLYRDSFLGVKRSSSADFRCGWSCKFAPPLCFQGVLRGDLYPWFNTLVDVCFCDASCLCGRVSGGE